jgi:hypothetical protein
MQTDVFIEVEKSEHLSKTFLRLDDLFFPGIGDVSTDKLFDDSFEVRIKGLFHNRNYYCNLVS